MAEIVDLHTHILPNMDDGSQSPEASVRMLEMLREQGADLVCLTSHYRAERESIRSFLERRDAAFARLSAARPAEGPGLLLGAETAYFPSIDQCPELKKLCIGGSDTLLLEMPFSEWLPAQLEEVISLVLDRRVHLVLAHPERFLFSAHNRSALNRLLALPIGLQVNAGTLICRRTRRLGLELLEAADAPMLGSDCHDLKSRAPNLKKARKVIRSGLGERFLEDMDTGVWDCLKISLKELDLI